MKTLIRIIVYGIVGGSMLVGIFGVLLAAPAIIVILITLLVVSAQERAIAQHIIEKHS